METAEAGPADLHRAEAGEDEARRRDLRAVGRCYAVVRIYPQRVVVANAFAKTDDRQTGGIFVVEAGLRAQLRADQRPHVRQHLIGECGPRKFGGNARGFGCIAHDWSPGLLELENVVVAFTRVNLWLYMRHTPL